MADWLLCAREKRKFDPLQFDGDIHTPPQGQAHNRLNGFPATEIGDTWVVQSPNVENAELIRIRVPFEGRQK
jgi:hypothetical protein